MRRDVREAEPSVWCSLCALLDHFVHLLREHEVAVVCDLVRRDVPLVVAALAVRAPAVKVLREQSETLRQALHVVFYVCITDRPERAKRGRAEQPDRHSIFY